MKMTGRFYGKIVCEKCDIRIKETDILVDPELEDYDEEMSPYLMVASGNVTKCPVCKSKGYIKVVMTLECKVKQ